MMDGLARAFHFISEADRQALVERCMEWMIAKHSHAGLIGARLAIRAKPGVIEFCCVAHFHPEQVFESRAFLPIESVPKGEGWNIVEKREGDFVQRPAHG